VKKKFCNKLQRTTKKKNFIKWISTNSFGKERSSVKNIEIICSFIFFLYVVLNNKNKLKDNNENIKNKRGRKTKFSS
jgi:hypothetical protein